MSIYLLVVGLFFCVANIGLTTFGQLLEKDRIVFNYSGTGTTADNHTTWKKDIITHYCPRYCDELGLLQPSQTCSQSSFCCKVGDALICCEQSPLAIKDDVTDAFNCHPKGTQRVVTETNNNWKGFNDISPYKQYCPSHCNALGQQIKAYNCLNPPYCCNFGDYLECCNNRSLSIAEGITDGYNCQLGEYWQLVLAVCVPLATLSLIAFLSMTSYLMCIKRRERQRGSRQRTGSGSDISCSSWSVSTVSPNNTMRGNPSRSPGGTSEHTCSRRQRPLEIFVLGPLIPPPYIDKPPPYSAVCNNIGEPNAGYDTTDLDSLPDYESLGLDPMALLNSNVLAVRGAHLYESQATTYHELNEDNVNQGRRTLNENGLVENNDNLQNSNNVILPVTLQSISEEDRTAEDTVDNSLSEEGVIHTIQTDENIVVQFHNSTHSDS